jgi:hypothetical protein
MTSGSNYDILFCNAAARMITRNALPLVVPPAAQILPTLLPDGSSP